MYSGSVVSQKLSVTSVGIQNSVCFTKSINDVDWSFLKVKVNVFGHGERFVLPILSPRNNTKRKHGYV